MIGDPLYRLEGSAQKAAARIYTIVKKLAAQEPPIQYPIGLRELADMRQRFFNTVRDHIEDTDIGLLRTLGFDHPVIAVSTDENRPPRAYRVYPHIFLDNRDVDIFYMYPPVAHDGTHFTPADSVLLDADEKEATEYALFCGGRMMPFELLPSTPAGTALPAGFNPDSQPPYTLLPEFAHVATWDKNARFFIPSGASLAVLERHAMLEEAHDAHVNRLIEAVKKTVLAEAYKNPASQVRAGEGLYLNVMYRERAGAMPLGLEISVCLDSPEWMRKGQKVPFPLSGEYNALPANSVNSYLVYPAAQPVSADGAFLKNLFDTLPDASQLTDFPALRGPEGTCVYRHDFCDIPFLVYTAGEDTPRFCPTDAIPVSVAFYKWTRADHEDSANGILPPPKPDSIRQEAAIIEKQLHGPKTGLPKPSPA